MATVPRRPRARLLAGLGAAVAALVVVGPAAAAAAGPLVPGSQWSTTVDLPDSWARQADRLSVAVSSLAQAENGCLRPETAAGDTTCGDDGGDLAGLVSATVAAGRYAGGACSVLTEERDLDLLGGSPARVDLAGPECVVLTIRFPEGPDDDLAQSDDLAVSLALLAGGPGEVVQPGGAAQVVQAGGAGGSSAGGPSTQPRVQAPAGVAGPAAPGTAPGAGSGTTADPEGSVVDRPGGGSGGATVGEATAEVAVGAADTVVEAESADRLLDDPFALAALLLGTTLLFWVLFLLLRRRRGRHA